MQEKFSNFGQIAEGKYLVIQYICSKGISYVLESAPQFVPIHFSKSYNCIYFVCLAVKLVKDETSRRSKGYAYIQYTSQDDAMLALENMDHQVLPCHFSSAFFSQEISPSTHLLLFLFFIRISMAGLSTLRLQDLGKMLMENTRKPLVPQRS